ncbi:hypothetical protein F4820DRAFT_452842 [Hypoxylon rubiginosum]|uniref:Uncharacterized protein n=1 Tax=Hypoxylon rubiginosum TaxID=110542 RepID=A0ACB9YNJ5_9PEZI|nr:hypothetical protein F4820DRAFT_452842 [Hypoxylon rubiginosum]
MVMEITPRLKAYFPKGYVIEKFYLGEDAHDFKYTVSNNSIDRKTKALMSLHDGPTEDSPAIATIHSPMTRDPINEVKITVQLPSHGYSAEREKTTITLFILRLIGHTRYAFRTKVGQPATARVEKFEWRPSHGNEVRTIHPSAYGCKLVRVGQEGPGGGEGGARKTRQSGETSDGKEVVAVWGTTHGLVPSVLVPTKKPFTFQLCGSGKTGELGEEFSIFALMTALQLYTMTEQPM